MKTFLSQFAIKRTDTLNHVSWAYNHELDQNVFDSKSNDLEIHCGTSTFTKVAQESTDSDFSKNHHQLFFGTKTITDVNAERTDTDYSDDQPLILKQSSISKKVDSNSLWHH